MRQDQNSRVVVAVFQFVLLLIVAACEIHAQTQERPRLLVQPEIKTLPAQAKRFALIIGVDRYDDENITPLKGATNDANELATALKDHAGFNENQIIVLTNEQKAGRRPTRTNILKYLSNLKSLVPPDGLLLVAFSGHGIEREGRAFLIPYDATYTDDVRLLEETAISADVIRRDILESGVSQVLILLDACRNDPAGGKADSVNPLTEAYMRGFEFDVRNRGVKAFATLYATSIGARAYEDVEKKVGYFTLAVVEALRGKAANPRTGEVTLQNLVSYIETNVPIRVAVNLGGRKVQKPFADIQGYKASELVLSIGTRSPSVEPDFGVTSSVDNEREAFLGVQNSKDITEIRAVLKEYPTSRYADGLRNRLDRLVWESIKKSRDKVKLQSYLDEFGETAQFASLARIEISKLTGVPTPNPIDSNRQPISTPSITVSNASAAISLADRALSEMIIGNDETAQTLATEALQMNGSLPVALTVLGWVKEELDIGKRQYVLGNDSARIDLEKAMKIDSKNALVRARLISVYQASGKIDASFKAAQKVLSLLGSPVAAIDYYSRGLANARLGRSAEATRDFTKAIELNPRFAHAYFSRGQTQLFSNFEGARLDYLKALEINPQFWWSKGSGNDSRPIAYARMSGTLQEKALKFHQEQKYDEAISEFTRAIELYPGLIYYQNRGLSYHYKKDYDSAIRDFDTVIKSSPDWSGGDVYFYRAGSYYDKGDYDQAIKDYTKSIERAPSSAAYSNRGLCYYNKKDIQTAIREYTKAIETDPNDAFPYRRRAEAYDVLGQKELAEADRKRADIADQQKPVSDDCSCSNIPDTPLPATPKKP